MASIERTALAELEEALVNARRPALLSSFGKDSMVLLHMARRIGALEHVEVVCHQTPYFREKWIWGERMAAEWNLRVFDWAPRELMLQERDGHMAVIESFDIGGEQTMGIQRNVQKHNGEEWNRSEWLCGRDDVLQRPGGRMHVPWDALISGQKSTDRNAIYGQMPLRVDRLQSGPESATVHFILRTWTDDDVWSYIEEHRVPVDHGRYQRDDATGKMRERGPRQSNDWLHACMRCVDRTESDVVCCPKYGLALNNVSNRVLYHDARPHYIGGAPVVERS